MSTNRYTVMRMHFNGLWSSPSSLIQHTPRQISPPPTSPLLHPASPPIAPSFASILSTSILPMNEEKKLSLSGFLTAVGQLKFRGTSGLFRLPKPVIHNIANVRAVESLGPNPLVDRYSSSRLISMRRLSYPI